MRYGKTLEELDAQISQLRREKPSTFYSSWSKATISLHQLVGFAA
jgi:hypothetical protein